MLNCDKREIDEKIFVAAIEAKGLDPLRNILKQLGGWPVVDGDSWEEENFDWMESIYKFRNVGYPFNSFISFDVQPDLKNNTKRVIVVRIFFSSEWNKVR